ncbi:MAG: SDR family oxidoreductase [Xanthobacteraceae bacterium]|nr:SDR family oxidoreductase [Xanthobacteraceae bacterium]
MNSINLAARYAIVTGGASGLGYAIAERFLLSGAKVAIWDRDFKAAMAAAQRLGSATPVEADVGNANSVAAALATTLRVFPAIDILVNNAGITGLNAKTWDYPEAAWEDVIRINLHGVFYVSKAVVPVMRAANYGRIVNVASVAGKDGNPNAPAYSASKAGVIALTKSLGKELADTQIRVNCVTPAAVETPLFSQMSREHIDFMLSKIPLGRFGKPEEIAALTAWLASEECSFSTGAVFDLSGGRSTY